MAVQWFSGYAVYAHRGRVSSRWMLWCVVQCFVQAVLGAVSRAGIGLADNVAPGGYVIMKRAVS